MQTSLILALAALGLSVNAQVDVSWSSVVAASISRYDAFQSYWSEVKTAASSIDLVGLQATGVEGSAYRAYESWLHVTPTDDAQANAFLTAQSSLFTELPTAVQSFQLSFASRISELSLFTFATSPPTTSGSLVTSKATTTAASSTGSTTTTGAAVFTGGAEKGMGAVGYMAAAGAVGFGAVAALL